MREWLSREDIETRKQNYSRYINNYTDYIDSLKIRDEVIRNNQEYSKLIKFCNIVLQELDKVEDKLRLRGFVGDIEYSKGYFRIMVNGHYKYRKLSISVS